MVREKEREGGRERRREGGREGGREGRFNHHCFPPPSCVWHPGSAPQLVSIDEKQLNLFKITGDSAKVHVHLQYVTSFYLNEILIFLAPFQYCTRQQGSF
jgi:hypothetical protein